MCVIQKNLRRLELLISKKHPARKVGTRSRQCRPKVPGRFAFPGDRNPRICSISRFKKTFPAIFPRTFPEFSSGREPPNRPRKQPQFSLEFSGSSVWRALLPHKLLTSHTPRSVPPPVKKCLINPLVCDCLSCLCRSCRFRVSLCFS